jgi:hypothetical protein
MADAIMDGRGSLREPTSRGELAVALSYAQPSSSSRPSVSLVESRKGCAKVNQFSLMF